MKLLERIRHIIRWIPVIWQDHDFDHYYLYRIIEFKLQNMYNFFVSENSHVKHNPKHIHKLKICLLLLKRINNDIIFTNDLAESCFRPPYRDKTEDFMDRLIKLESGNFLMKPFTEEQSRLFKKFIKHESYLQQQDHDLLHQLIAKYYKVWWD